MIFNAIIPIRKKDIFKKNNQELFFYEKSLREYTIDHLTNSKNINNIFISYDEEIIKQMLSGLDTNDYMPIIIKNRKKAIREGYLMLEENDIMLIAGKGHENYQEINKTRIPFSDIHEVKQLINLK